MVYRWVLATVLVLILGVGVLVILSRGKVGCGAFYDVLTKQQAGCGVVIQERKLMEGTLVHYYAANGVATGITYDGKNVFLAIKMPLGNGFFYKIRFRMMPKNDGTYEIDENKLKRLGYFDNAERFIFRGNETATMKDKIIGKEMMFVLNKEQNPGGQAAWDAVIKSTSLPQKAWLAIKGLLNLNVLNADQAGY